MNFSIKKEEIVDVLSKVQGLTGRRTNLAITECIRIIADDNQLRITATDLETGFEGTYPCIVETPGVIAISARKFYEIVREFPSSEILIHESENRLIHIGDEKVHYKIKGMNPDDFPDSPNIDNIDFFDLEANSLKQMIDKSIIVSGIGEDKKSHINGVNFEYLTINDKPVIRMVSTDGSRLSKYDLPLACEPPLTVRDAVLIPKKGLNEVSKFLSSTGTVQVGFKDSYFIIKNSAETIIMRLLEGQFPSYNEIIQQEAAHHIKIEKELFHNMLKRMSILCNDKYRAIIFKFEADELVIYTANPDIGESKENMAIEFRGEKIETAFNPRFFIEALNVIENKHLVLHIVNKDKACLVEGEEDKSYLSVIMPMKV